MIIRDEMRVERTNIIFGLCGNNTDLQTVRIKLGRLERKGAKAVLPAVGRARTRVAGFVPGSSAQGPKARDRLCLGLSFRHSTAIPGRGRGVAVRSPESTPEKPRGRFPSCRARIYRGGGTATLFCTVP